MRQAVWNKERGADTRIESDFFREGKGNVGFFIMHHLIPHLESLLEALPRSDSEMVCSLHSCKPPQFFSRSTNPEKGLMSVVEPHKKGADPEVRPHCIASHQARGRVLLC